MNCSNFVVCCFYGNISSASMPVAVLSSAACMPTRMFHLQKLLSSAASMATGCFACSNFAAWIPVPNMFYFQTFVFCCMYACDNVLQHVVCCIMPPKVFCIHDLVGCWIYANKLRDVQELYKFLDENEVQVVLAILHLSHYILSNFEWRSRKSFKNTELFTCESKLIRSSTNEKTGLGSLNPLDSHIGLRTWNSSSLLTDNVQTDSNYFSSSYKHDSAPINGFNLSMTQTPSVPRGPTDPYGSDGAPLITKNFETSELLQSSRSSKARQKKFHRHFKQVADEEKVLNYYSCALVGDILLQGHLYITENFFAFYSNVFGYVTKLLIPTTDVLKISKEKTAKIIPNAVGISTEDEKHVFGSLLSRDSTYKFMLQVWKAANSTNSASNISPPPVIKSELPSDEDSSASTGNEDPSSYISNLPPVSSDNLPSLLPNVTRKSILVTSLEAQSSKVHWYSFKTGTLLKVSLALLIFLLGSAGFLLYRIAIIEDNFNGLAISSRGGEMYEDIVKWQSILHSASADKISEFLNSNLNQIVKVRLSLEALSTLIFPTNADKENLHSNSKWESTNMKESIEETKAEGS